MGDPDYSRFLRWRGEKVTLDGRAGLVVGYRNMEHGVEWAVDTELGREWVKPGKVKRV